MPRAGTDVGWLVQVARSTSHIARGTWHVARARRPWHVRARSTVALSTLHVIRILKRQNVQ